MATETTVGLEDIWPHFSEILWGFLILLWQASDTWSILSKAVLYFKYLPSENVSLLIPWNSVKQLFFFCHKATASKQTGYVLFLDTSAAETVCHDSCQV